MGLQLSELDRIRRFVPAAIRRQGEDSTRRAQFAIAFAGLGLLGAIIGPTVHLLYGSAVAALGMIVGGLCCGAALIVLRASGSLAWGGNLIVLGWFCGWILSAYGRGGITSPGFGAIMMSPMIAALLVSAKAGVRWTIACVLASLAFFTAARSGIEMPDLVPEHARPAIQLVMSITFMTMALAVALAYELSKGALLLDVKQSAQELLAKESERLRAKTEATLMATAQSASLDRLAARTAHEINNPLTCVIANLEVIRESLGRSLTHAEQIELQQAIDEAHEGATRIGWVVRELRDVARLEDEAIAEVDIERVLSSTLEMIAGDAGARAKVTTDYGRVASVEGNEPRLQQVFLGILINALEAIPPGAPEKNQIRVATRMSGEGHVEISVSDTGAGLMSESTGRVSLQTCQAIVQRLRGDLAISSKGGGGTTVRVELRAFGRARGPAAPTASVRSPRVRPVPPAPRRGRMLIIEYDDGVARVLARMLRNHDVTVMSDSAQALECLKGPRPDFDVIFCDLVMPNRTGMEIYDELKLVHPRLADRMVFMSGDVLGPSGQDFAARVHNPFIAKPFQEARVSELVDYLLTHDDA